MSANDRRTPQGDAQLVREVMARVLVNPPALCDEVPSDQRTPKAPANALAEVSPRMIKAGESVLAERSDALMPWDLVKEIYVAMERARTGSTS